ncbi:MAG TPA: GAF and ANTAR domain-containing protein [Actinocrinis sp.]
MRGVSAAEVPARLCALCADLIPVTGASISLIANAATRRTLCASDRVARQLAEMQYTLGYGPCLQAFSAGVPVMAPDLGADGHAWPMFAHHAVEFGVKAVFSFPLAIGAISAGTLDLYRDAPGPLTETDIGVALFVADTTTLAVLRLYADRGDSERAAGADEADEMDWIGGEADDDEVHQATGMVMIQLGVSAEEALLRLRARAFARGSTVSALARDVVERRTRFDEDTEDSA